MKFVRSKNLSLKYLSSTLSGFEDVGVRNKDSISLKCSDDQGGL